MKKILYKRKGEELFIKAKSLGVILEFDYESFDSNRLDCLWYGGNIATIKVSDSLEIDISVIGDVSAVLYDKKGKIISKSRDKSNTGAFYRNMSDYIKNDEVLSKRIDNNLLELSNNNWIEYGGVIIDSKTNKRRFIDLGMVVDNILDDNVLVSINQVLDDMDNIRQEITKEAEIEEEVE